MFRKFKIVGTFILCAMLIPSAAVQAVGSETANATSITVSSPAAVVMDSGTGQIIYEKNADEKRMVSTVAKTMSLLLFAQALDNGEWTPDTQVQVSENAAKQGGSTAFLDNGAKYRAEDLLKAVCMTSANDACMALAEKLAGTEEAFVQRMNACAADLGVTGASFNSCTGFADENTKFSAKQIATIACELAKHSRILQYGDNWMYTLVHPGGRKTELTNTNRLIRSYSDCDGLQTGSNANAGYCMAATARRSGMRLICVVLGANDSAARQQDATNLFEYGFANFTSLKIVRKGEIVQRNVPVEGGVVNQTNVVSTNDVTVLVPKGTENELTKEVTLNNTLTAPVKAGNDIGKVEIKQGDKVLANAPVTVKEDIESSTLMYYIRALIRDWIKLF
ncbi:MAG: D-alanyl-D-alanine carboxypeptidase family protein [Bacillota bacterium]